MKSKQLLSLFVGLFIGLASMSTSVVGHSNLDSVDAMVQEVLAQVMAAGQEITAKEMARK